MCLLVVAELLVRRGVEESLELRLVRERDLDEPAVTLRGLVHGLRCVLQRLWW